MSPEGDIKVEIFGDGTDHASGYVLIHGGWNNSLSIIARLDEHGASLQSLEAEARRRGGTDLVRRRLDQGHPLARGGQPLPGADRPNLPLAHRAQGLADLLVHRRQQVHGASTIPFPLAGKGHDRFGFSSWEAQLYFDNLKIQPL